MLRSNTQNHKKTIFSDRLLLLICFVVILIASKVCFGQDPNFGQLFGPGSRPETPRSQQTGYQPTQQPEQHAFTPSQIRQMGTQEPAESHQPIPLIHPEAVREDAAMEIGFHQTEDFNASPLLPTAAESGLEQETVTKADILLKKKIKNGSSADSVTDETEEGHKEYGAKQLNIAPAVSMLGCLAVVLGVFFILAWVMKRATPQRGGMLPAEVFEKLGSVPYTSKMQLHLFRLGGKLILASVTSDSMEAVAEITNPDEVIHLVSLCKQNDPKSSSAVFRQILKQYTGEQGATTFYPNAGSPSPAAPAAHPAQTQMKQRPIGMVSPAKAYQR